MHVDEVGQQMPGAPWKVPSEVPVVAGHHWDSSQQNSSSDGSEVTAMNRSLAEMLTIQGHLRAMTEK